MDNKFGKGKVSDDLVKIVNGILEEEANHTHEVYNSKNMNVVGRYKNAEAARKAADKFDNKYGAYVHRVRPLKEDSEQIDEISYDTLNKYQAKAMRSYSKDRFSSDKKVADKAIKHGEGASKAIKKMAAKNIPSKDDRGYGKGRYMGDSVEVDGKLIEASGTVNAQVAPADQSSTIDVDQQKRKKKLTELYKSTVHSYKAKAEKDSDKHEKDLDSGIRSGDADKANKAADKLNRRTVGLNRADDRLNKEEVEQITESSGYDLYHSQYSGAIHHALAHHAKESGLEVHDDDYHQHISIGPRKPSEGITVRHNLPANDKDGNEHMIHMQIYNRGGNTPYELNTYSSKVPGKPGRKKIHEGALDDMKKAAYNAGHKHAMAGKDYDKSDMKKEWGPHFKHFESGHMNGVLDRKTQKNEEVESVTELAKTTLTSYVKKAKDDARVHGHAADSAFGDENEEKFQKHASKENKRLTGINKVIRRGVKVKENVEQIDEVSKESLKKTANKIGIAIATSKINPITYAIRKGLGQSHAEYKNNVKKSTRLNKEEVEQIDEVLGPDASISDWIHDFIHSKNPKFAGKSKEERRNQAIAAFYAKKHEVKEERSAEDKKKDELWAAAKKRVEGGQKEKSSAEERSGKARAGEYDWGTKKEKVEPITELKKTTIASYLKKKVKKMDDDKENFSRHDKDQKGLTSGLKRMLGKAPVSEDKNPEMDAGVGSDGQFVTNANTTSEPAPIKKKS